MRHTEGYQKNERLIALNEKAINHMLIVVAIYSLASSFYVVVRFFQIGFHPLLIIRFSLNVLILALFLFRHHITFKGKVLLIILFNLIIFASSLRFLGFFAADNLLLAIIPIFLSFVVKFRYAIGGLVAFLVVYIGFAILYSTNAIEYFVLQTDAIRNTYIWAIIGIGLTSISLGTMLIVHNFSKSLIDYDNELVMQNKELVEKENKYRTLFESSNDTIVIIKDEKFFDYNKKTLELFKCNDDYLKGKNLFELSPDIQPDGQLSKDKTDEVFSKISSGESLIMDWQHKRPNGELFEVSVSINSLLLNNEYVILAILRDVTERRRLLRELKLHKDDLEKLVVEKTKDYEEVNEDLKATNEELHTTNEELNATNEELYLKNDMLNNRKNELKETLQKLKEAQAQLVQSEKMASLGVLTAGVAHEINNPLNFIQAGIYSLENIFTQKKDLNEIKDSANGVIKNIQFGVERTSAIVRSLNTFSRSGGNHLKNCNVHEIIENALLILNHEIKNKCEVKKEFTIKPISIKGNEEGLHQVFLNVLNNAVQAIEGNDGIIKIQTDINDEFLEIRIIDNGVGIPEELKDRIFDPFFTTKDPGKGVGLGLSIVYKIIEDHKGEISYQSEEHKGTTANIKLPTKNKIP